MSGLAGVEQMLVEYAANAAWQLPLLAAGAWLLVRVARPGVAAQHRIWLGVLALAVVLPLRGAGADVAQISEGKPAVTLGTGSVASAGSAPIAAHFAAEAAPDAFPVVPFSEEPGGLIMGSMSRTTPHAASRVAAAGAAALAFVMRSQRVELNVTAAGWLAGVYLLVMLLGWLRLARAWMSARRLVGESRAMAMRGRVRAMVEDCARRTGVRAPEMRESGEIAGPVVVGMQRPVLLWPEGFGAGLDMGGLGDGAAATAALCHEMAHIRRRDYGMNLLCEAAAIPLKWHPVTYGVERRIRSTREMACDAMAATAMESETQYASCLVRLAESMVAGGGMVEQAGAMGLFNGNVLEERVMRLTQVKTAMSARARVVRGVAGGAAMLAAVGLAAAFYVVPATAQTGTALPAVKPVVTEPSALPAVAPLPALPPMVTEPAALPAVAPIPAVAPLPVVPLSVVRPVPVVAQDSQAAPAPAPIPAPATIPAPAPKPDGHSVYSGKDGRAYVWVDGQERELTPAERAHVKAQLAEAQKKIAAVTAKLNSPEFKKQMEDAQRKAMADVQRELNSPEFKAKMDAAQKQIAAAEAKVNSPEFRAQMEDAQRKALAAEARVNSPELRKQIDEAARQQALSALDSAKLQAQMADAQKQIAEATARFNSPEFRKQMEAAAKVNSAEIEKQLAEAQKQLAAEMEKLKAEQ